MSYARLTLVSAVAVGALLVLGAVRPGTVQADVAEKYFGCPSGYSFQTSGNNARCYLAGTASTANIQCGPGFVKTIDQFNGGKDGCQNQLNNMVGNYSCPSGYSPKVQAGPDVCSKAGSPSIMAPNIEKNL